MMATLSRLYSRVFGLKLVRCFKYQVSSITSLLEQESVWAVLDAGRSITTSLHENILAHIPSSHVSTTVAKVDTVAKEVVRQMLVKMASIRNPSQEIEPKVTDTMSMGESSISTSDDNAETTIDDDIGNNEEREISQDKVSCVKNVTHCSVYSLAMARPFTNITPMLTVAKEAAINYKSATINFVSNLDVRGKALNPSKEKEDQDETLDNRTMKKSNALMEGVTLVLLVLVALLYVVVTSCIAQLGLQTMLVMQKTIQRMGKMMHWIYQRRLCILIAVLSCVNIALLADAGSLYYST